MLSKWSHTFTQVGILITQKVLAHLYLQDMVKLKDEMHGYLFDLFANNSYLAIRRPEKFWSGVWTDMIIKKALMRSTKTQGGLKHWRGMGENVISKFILTMLTLVNICNEMERFCNVSSYTSDQHVDSTDSRSSRDAADVEELLEFFNQYNPFPDT